MRFMNMNKEFTDEPKGVRTNRRCPWHEKTSSETMLFMCLNLPGKQVRKEILAMSQGIAQQVRGFQP